VTELYGPFNAGAGAAFDETQWREFMCNLFTPGVISTAKVTGSAGGNLAVAAVGGNMNITIATGCAMVYGFAYENTASITKTISASDPSHPRIDYVVIEMGFVARTVLSKVLVGTPASSPVPPTLTQTASTWDLPLAQVYVGTSVTTLNSGNITDARAWCGCLPAPAYQGSGSALNADLVDGLNSSVFVLGNAASQHIIVLNRAPTNSDGVDGDIIFQWVKCSNVFATNGRHQVPCLSYRDLRRNEQPASASTNEMGHVLPDGWW
jgi:hypothetical protein